MKPSPLENVRLRRLEQRVALLVLLAVFQTTMLVILLVSILINRLLPGTLSLILWALGLALVVYVLRHRIPGWFSSLSRRLFAQMAAAQKPESMKDNH